MSGHNLKRHELPSAPKRMRGEIEPSEVQNAPLRKGLALWHELRGPRLFPSRQQMSPRALGTLLRNAVLIKVLDGGREFQIRVIGDAIMAAQGDPVQGMTTAEIDALLPRYGRLLHKIYSRVHGSKAPMAFRGEFRRRADNRVFDHEHILLPLGETDDAVDYILALVVYSFATCG